MHRPWSRKELDMTEQPTLPLFIQNVNKISSTFCPNGTLIVFLGDKILTSGWAAADLKNQIFKNSFIHSIVHCAASVEHPPSQDRDNY